MSLFHHTQIEEGTLNEGFRMFSICDKTQEELDELEDETYERYMKGCLEYE